MRDYVEEKRLISDELRILCILLRRGMDRVIKECEDALPRAQGILLCYLYEQREKPVYQRDVEAKFRIRRSTATEVLQAMERKGLIYRKAVPEDGRLKQICLTEKAMGMQEHFFSVAQALDMRMTKGISQADLDKFMEVAEQIRYNLEKEEEHD